MAREGELCRDVPPYRRMAHVLFPRRNDAAIYGEEDLDLTRTLPAIRRWNATPGNPHLTLFRLLLFALARTLHAEPRLNRFVAGRRLYQRDGVWLSFTAKKALDADAPLVVVKRRFEPEEGLRALLEDLDARLATARSDQPSFQDRELSLLLRLPRLALMGFCRLAAALDFWSLLPRRFLVEDPFFASAFLTNLGSVGGDAVFHHLYEYGTIPVFYCLGRVREACVVRDGQPAVATVVKVRYSYDERVEDGFNAVRALARLHRQLEDPEEVGMEPAPLGSATDREDP